MYITIFLLVAIVVLKYATIMIYVATLSFSLHAYTITHAELNKKTIQTNHFELKIMYSV